MTIQILSLMILFAALLCLRGKYFGPQASVYFFKPLTMLFILALAWQRSGGSGMVYSYALVAGLLFSLAGDVFLMLPQDRFLPGLASFLIAHLCYITAFVSVDGFHFAPGILLLFLLYGVFMLRLLGPHLGKMRGPVVIYMAVILIMGWQAVALCWAIGTGWSVLAAAGALLFVASDSILALNRFRRPFRSAEALILGAYFVAQWLIAFSVHPFI